MTEVVATPSLSNLWGSDALLCVRQVEKTFGKHTSTTRALAGVSFDIQKGEFVAIMGPSGSGKSTLLNCIATIDRVSSGDISIDGRSITQMSRRKLAKFRRDELGFIFQDFNLIDTLTGFENIALALSIRKISHQDITERVHAIASTLGIEGTLDRFPVQMSGGERQRVAAARAVVASPKLVLADEPTGALDSRSASILLEVLESLNKEWDATIMMVTHDSFAASFAKRVLFLRDGKLFNEIRRGSSSRKEFYTRIMEVVSFLGGEVEPFRTDAEQPKTATEAPWINVEQADGNAKAIRANRTDLEGKA